jgi:poly-gamma-glutamate synthesis protein (capsule biosynthesis protein)
LPPRPREFTVVATGDILLHERLWTQARNDAAKSGNGEMDFAPQLKEIRPVVRDAGLAICHLETPVAPANGPYEGYPMFSSPPQILTALAETGYDACTTASNHTFDQGAAGVDRTLDRLDSAGLGHSGSARTPKEAKQPTLLEVDTEAGTVVIGLLSFTYGFNGIPYPNGDEWRGNVIDEDAIRSAAADARDAGAEFVIVSLHWGDEYVHDPNDVQRDLAPDLIASDDIDLLLGHHAHVVQPVENVDGEWIVYGMGNLMAAHRTPAEARSEGLLVRFTITEDLDAQALVTTDAEYLPLLQTDDFPVGVINVAAALSDSERAGTASKERLRTATNRTAEVVERLGADDHGMRQLDQ